MNIPILELPQGFGWRTKYKALYEYYTSIKPNNFQTIEKIQHHKTFGFYFEAEWKKYRYKATMHFDVKFGLFTHFDIVIPGDIKNFDQNDFIRTFNLLADEFGKPDIHRGMSLDALTREKNYMARNPKDLPEVVWILGGSEIIHHFIDHWGNGPITIIREKSG